MQFHGGPPGASVVAPGKQIQAQRNDRGIQGEDDLGQIGVRRIGLIKTGRSSHQDLGDGLKQTPVAMGIGVGQIGSRKVAVKSQVITQAPLGFEADDDIAEAFPVSQLAETKSQKVIIGGESTSGALVWKSLSAARKLRRIQRGGDLRKDAGRWLHRPSVCQAERFGSINYADAVSWKRLKVRVRAPCR